MPRSAVRLLVAYVAAACVPLAHADPSPALDRVGIWVGAYYPDTKIDFSVRENSTGLDSGPLKFDAGNATLPRARLELLFLDSQGLSFDYYRFKRDRTETLDHTLGIAGNDIAAGASIRGDFQIDVGNAAYRWWLGSNEDVFGVGVGAAYYKIKAGLSAHANVDGQNYAAAYSRSEDTFAPLLTLGYRHAFSDALRVYLDASGVKKNGDRLGGHIYNAAAGVEWFPWQHIGIGAEYAATRIHLDTHRTPFDANLDLKLHGPTAYLRIRF